MANSFRLRFTPFARVLCQHLPSLKVHFCGKHISTGSPSKMLNLIRNRKPLDPSPKPYQLAAIRGTPSSIRGEDTQSQMISTLDSELTISHFSLHQFIWREANTQRDTFDCFLLMWQKDRVHHRRFPTLYLSVYQLSNLSILMQEKPRRNYPIIGRTRQPPITPYPHILANYPLAT